MATRQSLTASFRVGYAAEDGEDACILALSNEVEMVACDGLGNVSDVSSIEGTTWTFYVGNTAIDVSEYTYTVRATGCSVEYSTDGTTGTITVGAMTDDTATVVVTVTYDGTAYSRTYTITKNKASISYHIVASPSVLKANSSGALTTLTLEYAVRVYDNGTVNTYSDLSTTGDAYAKYGLYLYYAYTNSTSYTQLTGTGTLTFGTGIIANAYDNGGLTLSLYQGGTYSTGTLVDKEELEVVKDGNDGDKGDDGEPAYTLDLDNECEAVACDSDGNVTGDIQGTNFFFYVGAEEQAFGSSLTYSIVATGCTATASKSGTTGTVTIDTLDADTATVDVTVVYQSTITRTKTYTLVKAKAGADGTSPTIASIIVSPNAIKNHATTSVEFAVLLTTGSTSTTATFASGCWGGSYKAYWRLVTDETYGDYNEITSSTVSLVGSSSTTEAAFTECDEVEFSLYQDGTYSTGSLADNETVPCVDDGKTVTGNDGEDADFCELRDAGSTFYATVTANSDESAVVAKVGYNFACQLVHIVGDTETYVTSATVVASFEYTPSGSSEAQSASITLAANGNYYMATDVLPYEIDYTVLPDTALLTATYGDSTYTLYVQLTLGASSAIASTDTLYQSVFAQGTSISTLQQTADDISATVSNWSSSTQNLLAGLADGAGWTNSDGNTTYIVFDNTSYTGLAGIRASSTSTSHRYVYSPMVYLAAGQTYTLTVYLYGTGTTSLYLSLYYSETEYDTAAEVVSNGKAVSLSFAQTGETATFLYGSGTGTYYRKYATFTAPVTGWFVLYYYRSSTSYWVVCPQLEHGSSYTDWVPSNTASEGYLGVKADEIVLQVKDDFATAGMDITSGAVVIYANQVSIQDEDGNVAALFEDGKISADFIDADTIVVEYLEANNAVIEDLTVGNIVYPTICINAGNYDTYLLDCTVMSSVACVNGTPDLCLDVCSISGTIIIEPTISNVVGSCAFYMPFYCAKAGAAQNYARGYTTYNADVARAMSWEDFRRCVGKKIIITNDSGNAICLAVGYYYVNGSLSSNTSDYYYITNGYSVGATMVHNAWGFIWEFDAECDYSEDAGGWYSTESNAYTEEGLNWDVPDDVTLTNNLYWNSGALTSSTYCAALSPVTIPEGTKRCSIQIATGDGTYLFGINHVYLGTEASTTSITVTETLLTQGGAVSTGTLYTDPLITLSGYSGAYRYDFDVDETYADGSYCLGIDFVGFSAAGTARQTAAASSINLGHVRVLFY